MTREEAINNLNMISVAFVEPVTKEQRELIDDTFEMAIKALEQNESAEEWYKLFVEKLEQEPNLCQSCKNYDDNEVCLECEFDGITRGMTRYESVLQESSGDVISRQAVEDKLLKLCNELEGIFANIRMQNQDESVCGLCEYDCPAPYECPGFDIEDCFKLADEIRHEWQSTKDLPSVKQEPKTGHWVAIDEEPHEDYECNNCGYTISTFTANIEPHTEYKYCPNCGAKMVESEEI